jgi:di/tricarboxylate transporter
MSHLKARILAVILIIVFVVLIHINWHQLHQDGRYSVKLAAFAPVGVVVGFFLLVFPGRAGKPSSAKEKILVLLVFILGLAAGLLNWYLMDPGFFGGK